MDIESITLAEGLRTFIVAVALYVAVEILYQRHMKRKTAQKGGELSGSNLEYSDESKAQM